MRAGAALGVLRDAHDEFCRRYDEEKHHRPSVVGTAGPALDLAVQEAIRQLTTGESHE